MTSMTDALIAQGQEAEKSLAGGTGQAVRDNLFEAGRGLRAARQKFPVDQDFSTWLHLSVYSFVVEDERAALIKLGEYETELRPLIEGSTHTSAQVIWQQFKGAAEAMRFRSGAKLAADVRVSEEVPGSDTEAGGSSEVVVHDNDESGVPDSWKPPKSRPKNQTKLTKALGDNTDYLYGWFSANAIRQTLSPLTSELRGRPMLKTIAATVLDGSCRHARTADLRQFDVRMAFPHLPEKFARGTSDGRRAPTIYKTWSRLAELNMICAERSDYTVEAAAPNGTYLLRTPEHEHDIDRVAHHWWQTGSLLNAPRNCADNDPASDDPLPALPEGARELVFHGARVWPYETETISFEDACNSYRFVAELHGMLQAMLKSDKPGRAIKLRHYAKWMRRLSDPGADMFFRMASAISRNPDKEFEVKPPPLEVSYEE